MDIIFLVSNYLPYALIAIMPVFLWIKKQRKEAVLFLIAIGLNLLLVDTMKNFFNTPRPLGKGSSPSFPSAHASIAFCSARFLKFSNILFSLGLVLATFVGFGRVYTGYHTVLDVVVGAVIGYLTAELVIRAKPYFIKIYRSFQKKSRSCEVP